MHSKLQTSTLLILSSFLLCAVSSPQMFSQTPSNSVAARAPKSRPSELHRPRTQHELVVPFWTLEPGWNTQVEIRNNLAHGDLDVIAVLRRSDGSEVQAPPLTVSSDHIKKVDLQTVAPDWNGRADAYGSLLLRYNSVSTGNVYAAALVQRVGHPISFHFDAYPVTPSFATGSHETVWWLPQPTSDGYLIVSNFSASPVQARQILTQGKNRNVSALTLAPHQTQRTSIREAVETAGFQPTQGGVKLDFDADAGSVYVAEVLFDETAEFSALMKVFLRDPKAPVESFTLRAPLVGLSNPDPLLGFPQGTVLHPTVLVRNASSQAIPASMVVNWRGSSNSTGTIPVQSAPLSPEETRVLDLSALQGMPADAHWANVEITYTGRSGDLVPLANSYDQSSRYGLQSPFSDSLSFMWKGGMWHVDAQHGTLITTGNAGEKNSRVAITLFYGERGVYELPIRTLAPGGQVWIDVGQLIRDQIPDRQGEMMPPDTMEGSYEIRDVDSIEVGYLYEGKLITDRTFGHATYGCAGCCQYGGVGYDSIYLEPDPMSGFIGAGGQYTAWATNQCTGTDNQVTPYLWSSSVPAVASIDTHGWASFLSAGTSMITGTAKLQSVQNPSCRPQVFPSPPTPVNVKPTISGPNTLWWFNGETPTGYATSIALTASGSSGYSWNITKGSNMITLSGTTGSSVTASSTGTAFSSTTTDIAVTVTANGVSSDPFYITSRRPYLLVAGTITYQCASQYGYSDLFDYTIKDQMGANLPNITTPFNENWTTGVINDYPNNNWARFDPQPGLTSDSQFTDQIDGAASGSTPPTACPGAGQAVDHWGQEWFIGGLIPPGSGVGVQTDTIQKYTNHAEVQSITSPVP